MKHKLTTIILTVILFCVGCTSNPVNVDTPYQEVILSDLTKKSSEYLGLINDNTLLYYSIGNETVPYYSYNFDTNENIKLGEVKSFYLDVGSATLIADNLYYYVTKKNQENVLCHIDLKKNVLTELQRKDNSLYGLYCYPLQNSVVTLKNERDNEKIITYFDLYHTDTKTWERFHENIFDENKRIGNAIYVMYADGKFLYAIEDEYKNKEVKSYFVIYNSDLQEENRFLISDELLSFINENRITEMRVWNDFFYLKNISNNGFVGYIDNDTIKKIYTGEKLLLSQSLNQNDEWIFYVHDTNKYFTLDTENKKIIEHHTTEPYVFKWSVSSEDAIVFITQYNDTMKQICIKKDDLGKL